jgi:hypothetical protein
MSSSEALKIREAHSDHLDEAWLPPWSMVEDPFILTDDRGGLIKSWGRPGYGPGFDQFRDAIRTIRLDLLLGQDVLTCIQRRADGGAHLNVFCVAMQQAAHP